jgi:hypothetical protein
MTIRVGDPVRHCGEVSDKLFLRYVGRVCEIKGDKAVVQLDGVRRIFKVASLCLGITAGRGPYLAPKSKRGGIGFGMVNQAVNLARVS